MIDYEAGEDEGGMYGTRPPTADQVEQTAREAMARPGGLWLRIRLVGQGLVRVKR